MKAGKGKRNKRQTAQEIVNEGHRELVGRKYRQTEKMKFKQ